MDTNIKIRRISKLDLSFILLVRNECRESLDNNTYFSKQDIDEWFEKYNPEWYIIYLEDDKNTPIGYFRTSDNTRHRIQIGCDIHKDFRGQGHAKRAYKIFIEYMFRIRNKRRIYLEVLSTNTIAIDLYTKLGFKEEGRKREHVYRNSRYIDAIIMGLLKHEYTTI